MKKSIINELIMYVTSLIISVIASYICHMMQYKNIWIIIIWIVVIVFSFLFIVFIRYEERGQMGSYIHYVYEYERQLLIDKIKATEKNMIIVESDEQVLETKQIVLKSLIKIRLKKKFQKKRKEIENDIKK